MRATSSASIIERVRNQVLWSQGNFAISLSVLKQEKPSVADLNWVQNQHSSWNFLVTVAHLSRPVSQKAILMPLAWGWKGRHQGRSCFFAWMIFLLPWLSLGMLVCRSIPTLLESYTLEKWCKSCTTREWTEQLFWGWLLSVFFFQCASKSPIGQYGLEGGQVNIN